MGPSHLLMRALALADDVAEKNFFKDGNPSSPDERFEVAGRDIVDLDALEARSRYSAAADHWA